MRGKGIEKVYNYRYIFINYSGVQGKPRISEHGHGGDKAKIGDDLKIVGGSVPSGMAKNDVLVMLR